MSWDTLIPLGRALGNQLVTDTIRSVDYFVKNVPPWKLVAYTTVAASTCTFLCLNYGSRVSINWENRLKNRLKQVPWINQKLEEELKKIEISLKEKYFQGIDPKDICTVLPDEPWSKERILERYKNISGTLWSGKNTGACYIDNQELDELILEVSRMARRTNPLHMDLNPMIRQLEAEIVRMTLSLFDGDEETVGDITFGGTDSIRHAVFTTRQRARYFLEMKSGWEMVLPTTAHPAFEKAAEEYLIKVRYVPVHPQGHPNAFQVDIEKMRKAINGNTILVVGSVPSYPYGIPDDITAISNMLKEKDPGGRIGLHADCCLGGFFVPFMEKTGYGSDVGTQFGFKAERVSSISADTHKYGLGEKGTSLVMYRNKEWREYQYFVTTEWPGGIYSTPTFPGSRPGQSIAALWAVMVFLGISGYNREISKIIETARALIKVIQVDEELKKWIEILGDPKMMVIPFASKTHPYGLNIYDLKEEMKKLGWHLAGLQHPPALHFCLTAIHGNDNTFVERFVKDLKTSITTVINYPDEKKGKSGDAVMYGTSQKLSGRLFFKDVAKEFWNIANVAVPKDIN